MVYYDEALRERLGGALEPASLLLRGPGAGTSNTNFSYKDSLLGLIGGVRRGEIPFSTLISYIEAQKDQTFEQMFPAEWTAAKNGDRPEVIVHLHGISMIFILGRYQSGTTETWPDDIALNHPLSASSEAFHHVFEGVPDTYNGKPYTRGISLPVGMVADIRGGSLETSYQGDAVLEGDTSIGELSLNGISMVSITQQDIDSPGWSGPATPGVYLRVSGVYQTPTYAIYDQDFTAGSGRSDMRSAMPAAPLWLGVLQRPIDDDPNGWQFGQGDYFADELWSMVVGGGYGPNLHIESANSLRNMFYSFQEPDTYIYVQPALSRSRLAVFVAPMRMPLASTYEPKGFQYDHIPDRTIHGLRPEATDEQDYLGFSGPNSYYTNNIVADLRDGANSFWDQNWEEYTIERYAWSSFEPTATPVYTAEVASLKAFENHSDGSPPPVEPRSDIVAPAGGGCWASLDGPSGCYFNSPLPPGGLPLPGDPVNIGMPGMPDFVMPIEDIKLPDLPPFDCSLPDLGNMDACPPAPGTGGSLPGGLDSEGTPIPGNAGISMGGPTKVRQTFPEKRCYSNKLVVDVIRELAGEMDLSASQLMFEGDCKKRFTKCFPKGSSKFDAIWYLADLCGYQPIDNGDGAVIIGEVKPLPTIWTFHEDVNLFVLERVYSNAEVYYAVEVISASNSWEPVVAFVGGPFSTSPDNVARIEVGPEISRGQAEEMAAREAAASRRSSLTVKVAVPYDHRYKLRHQLQINRPSRGFSERFMVIAMESDLSDSGHLHILTGGLLS